MKIKFNIKKYGILILVISVLLIALITTGLYTYSRYDKSRPNNIVVSNVTSASATVSWMTETPTVGIVIYGQKDSALKYTFTTSGKSLAYDDRDVKAAELEAAKNTSEKAAEKGVSLSATDIAAPEVPKKLGKYYLHHVTILGLEPEKEYFFMVGDGFIYSKHEDMYNKQTSFSTFKIPENIAPPSPAYGKVALSEESQVNDWDVSKDSVVYMQVQFEDYYSQILSSVTTENGTWYIDQSNTYGSDGTPLGAITNDLDMDVWVEGGPAGSTEIIQGDTGNDAPMEVIFLDGSRKLSSALEQGPAVKGLTGNVYADGGDCSGSLSAGICKNANPGDTVYGFKCVRTTGDNCAARKLEAPVPAPSTSTSTDPEPAPDPAGSGGGAVGCEDEAGSCRNVGEGNSVPGICTCFSTKNKTGRNTCACVPPAKAVSTPPQEDSNADSDEGIPVVGDQSQEYKVIDGVPKVCVKDESGDEICRSSCTAAIQLGWECDLPGEEVFASSTCSANKPRTGDQVCIDHRWVERPQEDKIPVYVCCVKTDGYRYWASENQCSGDTGRVDTTVNAPPLCTGLVATATTIYIPAVANEADHSTPTPPSNDNEVYEAKTQCEAACKSNDRFEASCTKQRDVLYSQANFSDKCNQDEYMCEGSNIYEAKYKCSYAPINSLKFDNLVKKAYAQDEVAIQVVYNSVDQTYSVVKGGLYKFNYEGAEYSVDVPDGDKKVKIYLDDNQNSYYDTEDRLLTEDASILNIKQESVNLTYELKKGFNFVSFPIVMADYNTASQFLRTQNDAHGNALLSIAKYDSTWKIVGNNGDDYNTNDFQIVPGAGYIIKANQNVTITVSGQEVTFEADSDVAPIYLSPGWKLIGLYGNNTKAYTAESLLDSITSYPSVDFTAVNVTKWTTSKQKYEGLQKEADESGESQVYGFDFPLDQKTGYFVKIDQGLGNWEPDKN